MKPATAQLTLAQACVSGALPKPTHWYGRIAYAHSPQAAISVGARRCPTELEGDPGASERGL